MSQLQPINNAASLYVNNLQISNNATTPNTKIDVAAGAARDSNNVIDLVLSAGVTINCAVNGINGLDSGSLANSTWYAIFIIGDSRSINPEGCIASTSASAPALPLGYDSIRLIGWMRTDGSAHFLKCYVAGNGGLRKHYWDSSIAVLTSGTATTLTTVDLATAVPAVDKLPVRVEVAFTPATANDKVSLAPFGSTATALPNVSGVVAAKIQTGMLEVISKLSTSAKILYINSAAAGNSDLSVLGFDYFI